MELTFNNNMMMKSFLWKKPPCKLAISRSEIHVWKREINIDSKKHEDPFAILSKEEIQRLKSFQFAKDRFFYAMTHVMKRWVLAQYLNEIPEKLNFTFNEQGKPSILKQQNWLNLEFNISHSHQIILIALTLDDPIGIDVEYHSQHTPIEDLSEFIFSPVEKYFFSTLASQEEKINAFFRCWTRKEAYLKAEGVGLTDFPNSLSVDMNENPVEHWLKKLTTKQEFKEKIAWRLFPLPINKLYTAAIVTSSYQKRLVGYRWP